MRVKKGARYAILVINVIIALLGLLLFSFGIIWIDFEVKYEAATQKPYIYIGAILIAIGLLLSVTTALACYAVLTRNQWILNMILFMSLLLFVIYVDYGTVAFLLKSPTSHYMQDFRHELQEMFIDPKENWETFYDYLHQKFHCCGYNGSDDFQRIHNRTHPKSCCRGNTTCEKPTYTKGCVDPVEEYTRQNFKLSGSISFTISVLNILSFAINYAVKPKKVSLPE
ncbi:CD151 antigen-like [Zophobas morio]|uniref:CD151 antigen-like n=1 Tax=Zophobas morio TaxID=2755281 RepID=UPI0030839D7E